MIMKKTIDFIKEFWLQIFFTLVALGSVVSWVRMTIYDIKQPEQLLEAKDGIQNHLVWSNKGECYFVRPHTPKTTYLIRVEDCDKK